MFETLIAERQDEADGIISLKLVRTDGTPLPPFAAGSHIDVEVQPGCIRQYSLCNDSRDATHYRLGILLEQQSRGGSSAIHATYVPGTSVRVSAPRNNFPLDETARHSLLLAAGIGVTPIYAMASRLDAMGASFAFHYSARTAERMAFRDELLAGPLADRLSLHLDDTASRFDAASLLATPEDGTHIYICGPAGFIDHVASVARSKGWPADQIHLEHFGADIDATGDAFEVECRMSGKHFQIPTDQTIAQVLIDNGIDVPLSCEQGVCGTCVTRVIEGLPDHRDMFMSEAEHAANAEMAICCSRSLSARLVLDL